MYIRDRKISFRANGSTLRLTELDEIHHVYSLDVGIHELQRKNRHIVIMVDCSASMENKLSVLKETLKGFISQLNDVITISIITFSGHESARLIAEPIMCTETGRQVLYKLIEDDITVLENTVFSEALDLARVVCKTQPKSMMQSCILITDGTSTPSNWSYEEEVVKINDSVEALRRQGVDLYAVGLGTFYDPNLLSMIVGTDDNPGFLRHISQPFWLYQALETITESFYNTAAETAEVTVSFSNGEIVSVWRVNPELRKLKNSGSLTVTGFYNSVTTFLFEISESCKRLVCNGKIGDQSFEMDLVPGSLSDENKDHFFCSLGAQAFMDNDFERARKVLKLTSEGIEIQSLFTESEKREHLDELRLRYKKRKFIGKGLRPSGPNANVLNVLRLLIEDDRNIVFIGADQYQRGGITKRDPRVTENPFGRQLKVLGYESKKGRFNFSLLTLKDVLVLNERNHFDKRRVWRTYNVIRDGELVLPYLLAILSEDSFFKLQKSGVIEEEKVYEPTEYYRLDLSNLKVVSSAWAQPDTLGLVDLLKEESLLMSEQTALNTHIKTLPDVKTASSPSKIYVETSEPPIYKENLSQESSCPLETYSASCVDIRLVKKLKFEGDCSALTREEAQERLREIKTRLTIIRFIARSIIFAMEKMKNTFFEWDEGTQRQRGAYLKLEQVSKDGVLKRVTWTEQVTCS